LKTTTSGGIDRRLNMPNSRIPVPLPGSSFPAAAGGILLFILLLAPMPVLPAEITINSEEQFRFAEQAMEKGEYLRAVFEFERFINFFPRDEKVPEARLLIGTNYLKAGDFESARRVLNGVFTDYPGSITGGKALLLMGESYYRQGVFNEAEYYFEQVIKNYTDIELRNTALYRLGWARMQTGSWSEAARTFSKVNPGPLYDTSQHLALSSLGGETLPYKSPTTAGILAGVVPGLGHAYVQRYRNAATAFILNGLFIWATVESFDKDLPVLGAILGFAELGWYSGNIYSAVNSTQKYNRKLRDDFLHGLPDSAKVGLFKTRDGRLGLCLKIDF